MSRPRTSIENTPAQHALDASVGHVQNDASYTLLEAVGYCRDRGILREDGRALA